MGRQKVPALCERAPSSGRVPVPRFGFIQDSHACWYPCVVASATARSFDLVELLPFSQIGILA